MGNKRIESLDSLRGLSAFIVVIFHCLTSYVIFLNANFGVFETEAVKWFTISPLKLLWAGNEAVLLFFVLSGFVLSLPLFNGKNMPYSGYIVKRFFRIYMPFIIVMTISAILATLFMGYKENGDLSAIYINRWDHEITLKAIIAYILMINYDVSNVNGVVWSLFHEMRVSVIFPFIALVIYKFNFFKSFIILAVTYAVAWYTFSTIEASTAYHRVALVSGDFLNTVWYTIFFIAGSYLARYLHVFNFLKKSKWYIKLFLFIVSILLINCKLLYVFDITNMKHQHLFSLFGILLLFIVVLNSSLADKILTLKPFLWLGKVSYSLYLIHIPVIMLTTIFLGQVIPMWAAFAIATVLTLPVAGLAYRLIEMPSIHMGKKAANFITRKR